MSEILDIEKSAYGGQCISHLNGKIVFIPFAVPGEKVRATIVRNKSDYAIAEIAEILAPSDDRIEPECPNYGRCGGCDYLHMTYEREIAEKIIITRETLVRGAKIPMEMIPEIKVLSSDRFHYRSHARIKYSRGKTGFFGKDSHNVIPFPGKGCLLLDERINPELRTIRFRREETHVAVDHAGNIIAPLNGESAEIIETANGIRYQHSIESFFQRNFRMRGEMINRVLDYAGDCSGSSVLELGCGCGFFSIPLARAAGSLRGIDISENSIRHAARNAEMNGITNARFEARDDATIAQDDSAEIIVADPPRAGLSDKTKHAIIRMNPCRIVYVSCSPPTWARDVRFLAAAGYELKSITMIDMFPGTKHIEVISEIGRKQISGK